MLSTYLSPDAAPAATFVPGPLAYGPREIDGRTFLAIDPPGGARVVEALGDVTTADHVAVLVPGNGHHVRNYLGARGAGSLRSVGLRVLRAMQGADPSARAAVVVWVGYLTPPGITAAFSNRPARDGAADLAALTHYLPRSAHLTVIGHSYGSTVAGFALSRSRVDDLVALGSPGMGVRRRSELGDAARVWVAQADADWIRHFPRLRFGSMGLGRGPLHPELGATRFGTGSITGHLRYYAPGSESLRNTARIATGLFDQVTSAGAVRYVDAVHRAAHPVVTGSAVTEPAGAGLTLVEAA